MSAPVLSGHGLAVSMPRGWEGRIFRREAQTMAAHRTEGTARAGTTITTSDRTNPVMHLANFALPADRGDYGSGAVDVMGPTGVLVVLFEFGPDSAHTALFAGGRPTPRPQDFRSDMLQRAIPGQVGWQRFFTEAGRAFSLYVVLGSGRRTAALCAQGRTVVSAIRIGTR